MIARAPIEWSDGCDGCLRGRDNDVALDQDVVRLAKGKNLATVATLMPDGHPQALLTWVDADDEYVLVNTEPQRQRAKNVKRDPRITVLIQSADNPWDWVEVRGKVVEMVDGQEAREHIDQLAHKYLGVDSYPNPIGPGGRLILKVAPTKINKPPTS
jgi:PPOX class probable F420-dependent enzyme